MDEAVAESVRGWLTKASHDLAAARKLAIDSDSLLDVAIYHCQQAAEKAIKGWLTSRNAVFSKTHDVRSLIALAAIADPRFDAWLDSGQLLTPYATAFRYPDEPLMPDRAEFEEAFGHAEKLCSFVFSALPPEVRP